MKKARKVILILLLVLFIVSCRPQPDLSRDFPETETWGETFEVFWKKMSTNYLFWSLDYDEGRGWDSVYDEYKEKFDALGLVEDSTRSAEEQKKNTLKAYRYFFEITKSLSDGHYALEIDDKSGNRIRLSPSSYRSLKNYGFNDDDIFKFLYDPEYLSNPIFSDWLEYCMENTATIMEKTFGLPSDVGGYNDALANGALAEQYHFSAMKYFNTRNGFHIVLGRNSEGIVYFSFSGFNFNNYFDEDAGDNGVVKMIPTDGSVTGVYRALDNGFATIQNTLVPPSPPPGQRPTTAASPRSPRSPRSPTSTQRSSNNPSEPLVARNGCTSPRNPRVARAFENSIKRTGFIQETY